MFLANFRGVTTAFVVKSDIALLRSISAMSPKRTTNYL